MSNALAIGAVTAVLQNLLENGLVQQGIATSLGGQPEVTVVSPSLESANGSAPKDRLNLFLYQTTPNSGWRNVGMPSRNSEGDRVSNPPLALDLHYLLTAYSQEAIHAEIMLAYAMQLLHEIPYLPRDKIRSILRDFGSNSRPAFKALTQADLADQVEQIKITPMAMSIEEMSKLWSAIQTQYRPTAAYQASVVLIERSRSFKTALPVLERRLLALPYRSIVLTEVQPQLVTAGSVLTLRGQNLRAEQVRVQVGSVLVTPSSLSDREIQIAVPSNSQAGIITVQVVHLLDLGESGLRRGFESNILPFVLRPRIVSVELPDDMAAGRAEVRLTVDPPIAPSQRVTLLLNQQNSENPAAYSALLDKRETDQRQIVFPLIGIKPGRYLVRIQVDGAESQPEVDASNLYSGKPAVSINHLRVTPDDIVLTLIPTATGIVVDAIVTVRKVANGNESDSSIAGVTIAIAWTLPDGSTQKATGFTGADGSDSFSISGSPGTYTLTVVGLTKSDFAFDVPLDRTATPPRPLLPAKQITSEVS